MGMEHASTKTLRPRAARTALAIVTVCALAFACVLAAKAPAHAEETLEDGTMVCSVTFGKTGVVKKVKWGELLEGSIPQPSALTKTFDGNPIPATFVGWVESSSFDDIYEVGSSAYQDLFDFEEPVYGDTKLCALYLRPHLAVRATFTVVYPDGHISSADTVVDKGEPLSKSYWFSCPEIKNNKRLVFNGWVDAKTKKKVSGTTRPMKKVDIVTYLGSKCVSEAAITVPGKTYTGKAVKPKPKVKMGKKTLKLGRDYTVKYSNNVKTGAGKITIIGKGKYKGKTTVKFGVLPKATSITKVKPLKKGFKVSWKKAKQANGYVVWMKYAGEKYWRYVASTKGSNKTSCTVKNLRPGKKCYVKVAPVKWVKEKIPSGDVIDMFYGENELNWSKTKTVKTRK